MLKAKYIILFFLGISLITQAQAQVITGNVVEGMDRNFLDNVWVINLDKKDSIITNERGYFRVKGQKGDSLLFRRDYYIPKKMVVGEDTHIFTDIYLDARTLPMFDLYGERLVIPFKAGNQSSMRSLGDRATGPGKVYMGLADNESLMPGLTIDGPISYFMKSERQKRQYAKKLTFLARQKDYLDLIQSDSVMQALKLEYNLTDRDMDDLIIEFNMANLDHQFLDMDWERVEQMLTDFLNQRTRYRKEEPLQLDRRNPIDPRNSRFRD